jgi:EAL domain-containing protein (putative c-di-GMP-specific phosphodiesterase class I)
LRFLIVVVAMNGLVCIGGSAVVVFRDDGPDATVGGLIYVAALVAFTLTPVQLAAVAIVIAPRLSDQRARRRIQARVDRLFGSAQVETVFQPVFDLGSGRIVGAEALSRFPAEPDVAPNVWFGHAEEVGRGLELELLAVETALENAAALPEHLYVAINVSPDMLASPLLMLALRGGPLPLDRIVVELTERASISDYSALSQSRERLRQHGVRLAVDDAGAGYSSMHHIVVLAPEIIKIDKSLVIGIDTDPARRALVAAVVLFALESGADVLGEGVETEAVLTTLVRLGVESAQGYFLGHPTSCPEVYATWTHAFCPHRALADSQLYTLRPPTQA